jgi:CheY-like chemotaxis protein
MLPVVDNGLVEGVVYAKDVAVDCDRCVRDLLQDVPLWVDPLCNSSTLYEAISSGQDGCVLVGCPQDYYGLVTAQGLIQRRTRPSRKKSIRPDPNGQRNAVLVVEDDPIIRELQGLVVEEAGLVPLLASTLAEAREHLAVHASRLNLVMLDVHLPDGIGIDLCSELSSGTWPTACGVPIMIVTGDSNADVVADAFHSGAARQFQKPFQPLDLLRAVRDYTPAPAPRVT